MQRDLARLELRQVEELLHEPAQAVALGEHDLERLTVGLLDAVEEVLQVGPDGGDRRLEFVGDVGDEVAAARSRFSSSWLIRLNAAASWPDLVATRV